MTKITPNYWEYSTGLIVFYAGKNPRNGRIYIRAEKDTMGETKQYERVLLEQFSRNYAMTLQNDKLTPIPECVEIFVRSIISNKHIIEDAINHGIEEITL